MNRRDYLFLLFSLGAAPLTSFAADTRSDEEQRALKPIVEKGDTWTYRTVRPQSSLSKLVQLETITVTLVDEATDSIHTDVDLRPEGAPESPDPEQKSIWTLEWNVKLFSRAGYGKGQIIRPHAGILRFPLKAGDKYEYTSEVLSATKAGPGPVFLVHRTSIVTGWEKITVPAGTFRTIVIEASGTVVQKDNGQRSASVVKFWYSPDVRRWVKSVTDWPSELENTLLSFKLREN